jgi:hypothetical protein
MSVAVASAFFVLMSGGIVGVLGKQPPAPFGVLGVELGSSSRIEFPLVRVPTLTGKVREALEQQASGLKFALVWQALLGMQGTLPIYLEGK